MKFPRPRLEEVGSSFRYFFRIRRIAAKGRRESQGDRLRPRVHGGAGLRGLRRALPRAHAAGAPTAGVRLGLGHVLKDHLATPPLAPIRQDLSTF